MKVRDVIKMVESDGWYFVEQEGSHRQYKHPVKKGRAAEKAVNDARYHEAAACPPTSEAEED